MFRSGKYRLALWFFRRPILPFAMQLVVLTPLVLAVSPGQVTGGYLFALPWLIPLFGVLNLPFMVLAFRSFRRDVSTRRNHALEHATILFLEATSSKRFSGRAARDGFRVCGPASAKDIKAAFEQVRDVVREGEPLMYISRRCGSNVVTALALGTSLLLLVALGSVVFEPPRTLRAAGLVVAVLVFLD